MRTRPRRPITMRTRSECQLCTGMKSTRVTAPSSVSNSVSRISVSRRYWRRTRALLLGAIFQCPCSRFPSSAAKHAGESKRGQHSQSMEPSRPTSAPVWQSPIRA
jgi:hypothetical protein